jgi:phage-related protein
MAKTDAPDRRPEVKPVFWIGSSRRDIRSLPKSVRAVFGLALFDAQTGLTNPDAKPLKGFGGAGVLEIVENEDGNTYRAVYTVKFAGAVYVLHVFQKKSKAGVKTPAEDIERIRTRLKEAEKHHAEWTKKVEGNGQERR